MSLPPGWDDQLPRRPRAGELFTDREAESEAFQDSLAAMARALTSGEPPPPARQNVLTFYGMGGIGKSSLSYRLESWVNRELPLVNGWGPVPPTKVAATVRIDLHASAGVLDIPSVLLAMRRAVGRVQRRWLTFDLAFAAYWSAIRPEEPTPDLERANDYDEVLGETIANVLADIGLAATGIGAGVRGIRRLASELQRRHRDRLAAMAFEGYADFLRECSETPTSTEPRPELASKMLGILSWEMSRLTEPPLVVVFVDTLERLKLDSRRISEVHLNEIVYAMPNVLFVMTGRDMLDWHDDSRLGLPRRGASHWPSLVPGATANPRQHRVGMLSSRDTRDVILRARTTLSLPIDDDVVNELVVASAGLPQYLEMAWQVAVMIRDRGSGTVTVADVTGSLDSLVLRVLEDVPPDEQRAIRAACLFRSFDIPLIAATAGVDHGCAERAVLRPMVDHVDTERYPYRIHDEIRRAIRDAGHHVREGWSAGDWTVAGERAVAEAHRRHDAAKADEDAAGVLSAIALAITVCCELEIAVAPAVSANYRDWLAHAIVFAPSVQGLRPLVPTTSRTSYGEGLLDFIEGKAYEIPLAERLVLLRRLFESNHPLSEPAGRHLSYTLRGRARWDESLAVIDEIVAISASPLNLRQRGITLAMARRFREALEADAHNDEPSSVRRSTEYAHGLPDRYLREMPAKLTTLRNAGRQREYLEERGTFLFRRALLVGDVDHDELASHRAQCEQVGHSLGLRDALLTSVALRHEPGEIPHDLDQLLFLEARYHEGQMGFRTGLGRFLDATVTADDERMERLWTAVAELPYPRSRSWIPLEGFFAAVGRPLPAVETQWLEPESTVHERWGRILTAYLERTLAPRPG